jgi:RNase adaptor protein for sRNA GlmZ degradation
MQNKQQLTISIHSFSYKKGIPKDATGNGGGYVFDCRGVLNPGRMQEYKTQTGRDPAVIDYLEQKTEMPKFVEAIKNVLSISIENYLERGFSDLQINFGCTGGQHRSVYAAEKIAKFICHNYPSIEVLICHLEQEAKKWVNEGG